MSCVLRVRGADFAVDTFLTNSSLKPVAVFRRGQPQSPAANPTGRKLDASGFHTVVSEADFSKLQTQIADAVRFLEESHTELSRLRVFRGIDVISLDFGIEERDVAAQSERFPPKLLSLLGDLGIWLEFTLYPGPTEASDS
ncbi:MAG TPA: hypothetical protein VIY69_08585 [Candidatus Acidoferrales bacterium]